MEDIELVIKIPKEMYKWVNDANKFFNDYGISDFIDLVKKGTLIPKGHGRLIDKDALGEKLHRYTEAPYQYALKVFNESPIIINADRSEDE